MKPDISQPTKGKRVQGADYRDQILTQNRDRPSVGVASTVVLAMPSLQNPSVGAYATPCQTAGLAGDIGNGGFLEAAKGERLAISLSDRVERLERAFWHTLDVAYAASLPCRTIRCIVCDHESKREGFGIVADTCQFGGGALERYCCPTCDCIFGPLKYLDLPEDFVSGDYALLYATYSEADSTENEIRTFQSLEPEPSGPYLDWGCGGAWSKTVDQLRGEGFDVWGYEPSAEAPGQFVVNKREAISARFDGIFSNNVIEHFRDPVAQFRDFHTLLKNGGRMAHSSPCYEYSYAYTRFHSLFLLGRSPHVLAERTGFRISNQIREGEYINLVFDRS